MTGAKQLQLLELSMSKNEKGHIVVETVGTFIPLVLLMISILSLVNIVVVQARIHYALTQAAKTISVYSYAIGKIEDSEIMKELDSVFSGINLMKNNETTDSKDTIDIIGAITDYAKSELSGYLADVLVSPIVERYLTNDGETGREFLKRFGVTDLDFSSSVLLDENENVKLTAHYKVDYMFGALPIPFGPRLSITQTVITKAWRSNP